MTRNAKLVTEKALTENEINAIHATIAESTIFEEDKREEAKADLSWFIDKLRNDSHIFIDWLAEGLDLSEGANSKSSFTLGAIHVAMPFFMREEAGEMDRIFL